MKPPSARPTSARSHNPSVQEKQSAVAAKQMARNLAANEATAKKEFPNETLKMRNTQKPVS